MGYKDEETQSTTVVPCLIIYPDQTANLELFKNEKAKIQGFTKFEKLAVSLPILKKQESNTL